jgi:hypothetical protein
VAGIDAWNPSKNKNVKISGIFDNTQVQMDRLVQQEMTSLTETQYKNFLDMQARYPNQSKDFILAAVRLGLNSTTPGVGKLASIDGLAQLKQDALNQSNIKKSIANDRGLAGDILNAAYSALKGTTRVGFAATRGLYDNVTAVGRDLYAIATSNNKGEAAGQLLKDVQTIPSFGLNSDNTLIGQLGKQFLHNPTALDTGSGFFVDPESKVGKAQAKAMASYGMINGKSFTLGRGFAKTIGVDPNSTRYGVISGIVDAVLNVGMDPTTYVGPGAITKIARGGVSLKGAKAAANAELAARAEAEQVAAAVGLTKADKNLLKELTAQRKEVIRTVQNNYLKTEEKFVKGLESNAKKGISTAEKQLTAILKTDENAVKAGLKEQQVSEYIINTMNIGKQSDIVDELNILSAEFKNTGEAFPGAMFLSNLPEKEQLVVGAQHLDEFVVKIPQDKNLKLLDLTQDFAGSTGKVAEKELANRTKLRDFMVKKANDFSLPADTRKVFANYANDFEESLRLVDNVITGTPETLGSMLSKLAAAKVPMAVEMVTEEISKIWKIDGFDNVRSIYGGTGGVAITNADKIAARSADISTLLADSTINGSVAMLKVPPTVGRGAKAAEKRQKALDKARQELDTVNRRLEDVKALRNYAARDPEFIARMVNSSEYKDLQKVINLELKIGEKDFLKEFTRAEVGLVDAFGGNLSADATKAMKFLFGKKFQAIAGIVAKETDALRIDKLFGRKLDMEVARDLASAQTPEEVVSIFLRQLASPEADPQIARGLLLRTETALATNNPILKAVDKVNIDSVKWAEKAQDLFSDVFVRSTILPLDDIDRLARGLEGWFKSAKIPDTISSKVINDVIKETDTVVRGKIIMDGIKASHEHLIDTLVDGNKALKEELKKELANTLKVAGKDEAIVSRYNYGTLASGLTPDVMIADGKTVGMRGAIYAHQFMDDVIQLRDTRPIANIIRKYNTNIPLYGQAKAAAALVNEFGDYWRQAQLAWRVAYTLRNITEMQLRMFFSGHDSMFSHPLSYISMIVANPKGNAFQKMLASHSKYNGDVLGNKFDTEIDGQITSSVEEYIQMMKHHISRQDNRTSFVGKMYELVDNNHPDYHKALAISLMRFGSDDLMPIVAKATTQELKNKAVADLVGTEQGFKLLSKMHNASRIGKEAKEASDLDLILMKDINRPFAPGNINREGLYNYLFDPNSTASYQYALNALMGNSTKGELVRELLAEGRVKLYGYYDITLPSYKQVKKLADMNTMEIPFKKQIEKLFPSEEMTGSTALNATTKVFRDREAKFWDTAVDIFFQINTKIENVAVFGPEYRMAYWDYAARYAPMLSTQDLTKALKIAHDNLDGLKVFGKAIRKHPSIKFMEKEMARRGDDYVHQAGITLNQLNSMAGKSAAKYTKDLFYDASKQLRSAQAIRLIIPFAQAWGNTIKKWGELAVKNPINFYKFGRVYNSLTKPGSSTLYDITGVEYNDGDGFIYTDEFGEQRFRYPIAGSFIGGLVGKAIGVSGNGLSKLELTAPVQSLNLAFGNVNAGIPGFGPAASFMFQATGKSAAFGPVWNTLRTVLMPFGESDKPIESLLPAWLRKGFLFFIGNDSEVQKGVKDWASYLASTGEYGENPLENDDARNQLFQDAQSMSQGVGLLGAFFQNILPATPSNEIFVKIPTAKGKLDFATLTVLYDAWRQVSDKHPGDYMKAVTEFSQEFGSRNLLAIMGGSTRAVTGTEDAWSFMNKYPDVAEKYATMTGDVIPYFFPGGEASTAYYAWQKQTGRREKLNSEELAQAAEELVYKMAKSQISEEQAAFGYSDVWYTQQILDLNKRFGGAAPASTILSGTDKERIASVGKALKDERFQLSPVYNETKQFYDEYQKAIQLLVQTRVTAEPDLGSSHWYASNLRVQLTDLANELMMKNPAFAPMYYRVFAGTMKQKG